MIWEILICLLEWQFLSSYYTAFVGSLINYPWQFIDKYFVWDEFLYNRVIYEIILPTVQRWCRWMVDHISIQNKNIWPHDGKLSGDETGIIPTNLINTLGPHTRVPCTWTSVLNRRQAIILTNADPIHWCIYATLGKEKNKLGYFNCLHSMFAHYIIFYCLLKWNQH